MRLREGGIGEAEICARMGGARDRVSLVWDWSSLGEESVGLSRGPMVWGQHSVKTLLQSNKTIHKLIITCVSVMYKYVS